MPNAIHRHYSSSSSTLAPLRRRVVVAHSCRLRKHDVKFDDFNISDVRCGRRRPTPTTTTIAVVVRFQLLRWPTGLRACRTDQDRPVDVLKWMFLRLRDVDTSLCFTAAAAAAVMVTSDWSVELSVIVSDDDVD